MRLVIFILILNIPLSSICFFWVPNRYTAPYWPGDTRITSQSIGSIDLFIGRGSLNNETINYTSINSDLVFYQTIAKGFFIETTVPTTTLNLKTKKEPFIHQKGGMCYENSTILCGWGANYEYIPYIDFIDFMIRTGCIIPAHTPLNYPRQTESVYGYHEGGIPLAIDLAVGFCEWMLCGFHTSMCALHHTPLIWHIEPYFKADHLIRGLSFWVGYSYTGSFSRDIGQSLFFGDTPWHMHTMHYGIEFEFIQYKFPLHPRIGVYYNQCIGGKNIFAQSNGGLTVGLDIIW